MRLAEVQSDNVEQVRDYLPTNYRVLCVTENRTIIVAGEDDHGWTLDGYVIPRLGSGLIAAKEITLEDV